MRLCFIVYKHSLMKITIKMTAMTKFYSMSPESGVYFAEIQPLIQKRLMPIFLIIIASLLLASVTGILFVLQISLDELTPFAYWVQWFNNINMALTAVIMLFGVLLLRKGSIHGAVNILMVVGCLCVISQVFANGGMGEASIVIYPIMIMLAGFFGNMVVMQRVKRLLAASIVALYLLGVFGVKPPDMSEADPIDVFMRIDQMVYCLIILEIGFQTVKMFINDYGTVLSHLKEDQRKLDFVANHDTLTGLPNRYACERHFEDLFRSEPVKAGIRQLLLFIDIDNFKNINTRFGHNGGDEALQQISARLQQAFNDECAIVSRIGGDEFIVMLSMPDVDVESRLDEVIVSLAEPLKVFGQTEYVTCSMGVIDIESTTSTFKEEYRKADMAMNRAKKTGKNRYAYFNQSLNDIALKNIEMGVNLYEALNKNEFVLFYQAQVDLESGAIVGAEALIRWKKEDGQIISPADFIPIAEKNGNILGITRWVIRQACLDCASWHAKGFSDLLVSVNIPSSMLIEGDLPLLIREFCDAAGLPPKYLELELTESVLLENGDYIQEQLQVLREMGVSLAIDDFGTGYSNLSYLSRLNVQKLKVDQYFVMNLIKSDYDRAIIEAVVHIANSFGMKTVAEGIEDAALVALLLGLKCNIGQGYLWSKPVPLDSFMALLNDYSPAKRLTEVPA